MYAAGYSLSKHCRKSWDRRMENDVLRIRNAAINSHCFWDANEFFLKKSSLDISKPRWIYFLSHSNVKQEYFDLITKLLYISLYLTDFAV